MCSPATLNVSPPLKAFKALSFAHLPSLLKCPWLPPLHFWSCPPYNQLNQSILSEAFPDAHTVLCCCSQPLLLLLLNTYYTYSTIILYLLSFLIYICCLSRPLGAEMVSRFTQSFGTQQASEKCLSNKRTKVYRQDLESHRPRCKVQLISYQTLLPCKVLRITDNVCQVLTLVPGIFSKWAAIVLLLSFDYFSKLELSCELLFDMCIMH